METFTHEGLTVAYRDEGTGPGIVMLHNGGTSSTIWRHQVEALSEGHRVVAVDLPGFGASERPATPADLSRLVELTAALVEELDMAPALLVGNCMGTNIAATLARAHPRLVRGILAVNPLTEASFSGGWIGVTHKLDRVAATPARALRSVSRRVKPPRPAGKATLRFMLGSKGIEKGLQNDPELIACQVRADQMPALVDVLEDMASYGELDELPLPEGTPIWIVWGEQNRVLSRKAAKHLEGTMRAERVSVVPGTGHLPMLEDPDAITAMVEELLERTAQSTARPGGTDGEETSA